MNWRYHNKIFKERPIIETKNNHFSSFMFATSPSTFRSFTEIRWFREVPFGDLWFIGNLPLRLPYSNFAINVNTSCC